MSIVPRLWSPVPRQIILIVASALLTPACGTQSRPAAQEVVNVVVWRPVGTWSGKGNRQTESFSSVAGALRVRWETRNELRPGAGTFRLSLHSAVSGRFVTLAAEHRGVGRNVAYFSDDYSVAVYLVIESSGVEWSFTVDEGIIGTVAATRAPSLGGPAPCASSLVRSRRDGPSFT